MVTEFVFANRRDEGGKAQLLEELAHHHEWSTFLGRIAIASPPAGFLFADDQPFLHETLDKNDPLFVREITGEIANRVGRAAQGKVQGLPEEILEENAARAEVDANGVVDILRPIDGAAPRPHDVVERQRLRLEELGHQTRDVEVELGDELVPELLDDAADEFLVGELEEARHRAVDDA